jgi:hypothetical protein
MVALKAVMLAVEKAASMVTLKVQLKADMKVAMTVD